MPDTIRQQIVNAVQARFAAINPDNGYNTDFTEHVFVWRITPFQAHEVPAVLFRDVKNVTQPQSGGIHNHELECEADVLTVISDDSAAGAETIRKMIADIWKALGVDRRWTVAGVQLAYNTEPKDDETAIGQEGGNLGDVILGGSRIKFVIHYRTASFDPYNAQ